MTTLSKTKENIKKSRTIKKNDSLKIKENLQKPNEIKIIKEKRIEEK